MLLASQVWVLLFYGAMLFRFFKSSDFWEILLRFLVKKSNGGKGTS